MKTKFFTMLFAALYAANVFGGSTVTFTASDFSGQGVSGTGGNITATKSGVTFTCDKAFGDANAARCYMGGVVTITSSLNQIEKIGFVFTDGKTGNLNTEYSVNAKQWTSGTLASQARMKTITVYLGEEAGGDSESGGTTGEATDGSFVGFEASSDHKLGTQIYEEGLIQNENNVTLLETDVTKHQYNINLINGGTGTFTMGGVTFSFTNEEAGKTAYKTYDQYIQPNGLDREITIPTKNGEQVKIVLIEYCAGILVNGVSQDFVAGDNILTATGSSIILKNASAKPKINAILSLDGGSTPNPNPDPENYENVKIGDLYYNLSATNKTAEVTFQLLLSENNYSGLATANIPSSVTYNNITFSVTSIGSSAFEGCSSLTSVTIPNSVTSIGKGAFEDCTSLTSVTIPNSVTSIGITAFFDCKISSINYIGSLEDWINKNWDPTYISSNYTLLLNGVEQTSITIPSSVTSIGDYAFFGCESLTSVTIGNSVTSIGERAFYGCSGLTSVTIGNSVTSIGERAFYGCSGLTSVTIGNSVTSIGYEAFEDCTGLTSITIPNSVTSIGDRAFLGCTGLTSVTIPNSVTSIGEEAFRNCSSLTSVTIPNSVTSIGAYAFWGCSALKNVILGSSLKVIESSAFKGCSSIETIICYSQRPPTVNGGNVLAGLNFSTIVYVPADYLDTYKMHDAWGLYDVRPLGAATIDTQDMAVTPHENTADIVWPANSSASTYELVISKDGEVICTLIFNANGQLTSIAFAPARHDNSRAPEQTEQSGFSFTVTGLEPGTTYNYTLTVKDASDKVLDTKTGTFTTEGITAVENLLSQEELQALLANPATRIYNLQGNELTAMRDNLPGGVYILRLGNKAGKVVIR